MRYTDSIGFLAMYVRRMRIRSARRGVLPAIVLSTMALSCELSSSFLSESERSALYSVSLNAKAQAGDKNIENGSFLESGAKLSATVAKLSGAGEVAYFDLFLEGTSIGQYLAGPAAKNLAGQAATTLAGEDSATASAAVSAAPSVASAGAEVSKDAAASKTGDASAAGTGQGDAVVDNAVGTVEVAAVPAKADSPKIDTSKNDTAKGDVAKNDAAKVDAAKGDAAKGDPVKVDATKSDTAKAGAVAASVKAGAASAEPAASGSAATAADAAKAGDSKTAEAAKTADAKISATSAVKTADEVKTADSKKGAATIGDAKSADAKAEATAASTADPAAGETATVTPKVEASAAETKTSRTKPAKIVFVAAETVEPAETYAPIAAIDGDLPSLQVPSELAPGAYRLTVRMKSAEGKILQKTSIVVFIGLTEPRISSVSVYPPAVEPGQALLLGAALDGASGDPWFRWSRDGAPFASGLLSEGADRVVWTAPRAEGAYALSLEVFPAAPPEGSGFPFRAAARRDLKIMVKASPGGTTDEFADPLAYLSLLKLDGSFEDSGVRSRESPPTAFGSPALDVYAGGFGYRLGEEAGIRVPGLMPPAPQGRSAPFSVVMRLAPAATTGRLLRFASGDGAYTLELGLEAGHPYAALKLGEEEEVRSLASSALPALPRTIVATIRPGEESSLVSWNVEGERIDGGTLPPLPAPPAGGALIGGPGSLPGVYDAFGLMSPAGPSRPLAPASYRLAMRRKWKTALALAEGFEEGLLPSSAAAKGGANASVGSIRLEGASSVGFSYGFRADRSYLVDVELAGDLASTFLSLEGQSGARPFSASGTGEIQDAGGRRLGSVPAPGGRLVLLLAPGKGGTMLISGADGRNAVKVAAPSSDAPYSVVVYRGSATGSASLSRILARETATTSAK